MKILMQKISTTKKEARFFKEITVSVKKCKCAISKEENKDFCKL